MALPKAETQVERSTSMVDSAGVSGNAMSVLSGFAEARGLPTSGLTRFGIDVCPSDGPRPGWIRIPYTHRTGTWGYRYRNPAPRDKRDRYWNPPGQEVHLYNPAHVGFTNREVFFTEGEMDTLVLLHLGLPAVGLPGANAAFRREWVHLFKGADAYLLMDGDDAGRDAAQKLLDGFKKYDMSAMRIDLPNGYDVNDLYLEDRDELLRLVGGRR